MADYALKLYIAGDSVHSDRAVRNLQRICGDLSACGCRITIVDVLEDPAQAEIDRVLATPTLIRVFPEPQRRVIGDLSDADRVLTVLGLPCL